VTAVNLARLSEQAVADAFDWLEDWARLSRIPGLALVVTDAESTRFIGTSGVADRVGDIPVTPQLRWQIGSISKAFTAISLLQLQQSGRLSVTDRLVDHLPWAQHVGPDVTLHSLLTHTSGLPTGSEWCPDSRAETARLGSLGLPGQPGERFHYSNSGYEALGDVVEALTGSPVDRHLEQAVLAPLGMSEARGAISSDGRAGEVRGHRPPDDDQLWRADCEQVPEVWFPSCTADGAIVATPEDMGHYLRFLLRGEQDGVLSAADFAALTAAHAEQDSESWYGYGIATDKARPAVIGHSGGMVGMYADVRVDRETGIGVCLLINGMGDPVAANRYLLDLLRADVDALPRPTEPEPERPPQVVDDPKGDPAQEPYVGLYRAHNPWAPVVRVLRKGSDLVLVDPVSGECEQLDRVHDETFRAGGAGSPESVRFDLLIEDEWQQLDRSGCSYYRARRDPVG
jgi:CubicO group peptidase (beta-lactamase class C family)